MVALLRERTFMGRTSDAKEKLLDVAFKLIWDRSYGSVSVDQICERAGVNKGSFYHFYGTKADLACAAYDDHWRQKQPNMDRIFSAQTPPLERISGWCNYVYEAQKAKAAEFGHVCGCPYGSIGTEVATQDDKIRVKAEEILGRSKRYVESAIADAKREGLVPEAIDPKQAAQKVFSLVCGSMSQAKIQNDVEVLRDLTPTVMTILGAKTAALA
jgi:TetR/AcrR family transcriptional regulator, transcriptional repressor for nem operon